MKSVVDPEEISDTNGVWGPDETTGVPCGRQLEGTAAKRQKRHTRHGSW